MQRGGGRQRAGTHAGAPRRNTGSMSLVFGRARPTIQAAIGAPVLNTTREFAGIRVSTLLINGRVIRSAWKNEFVALPRKCCSG